MTILIISCIVGILIGAGIIYLILIPKVKHQEEINESVIQQNQKAYDHLEKTRSELQIVETKLLGAEKELSSTIEKNHDMVALLSKQEEHAKTAATDYYNAHMAEARVKLSEKEREFKEAEQNFQDEYLKAMVDAVENYRENISASQQEYFDLIEKLDDLQDKVTAAVEAAKRNAEMENKKDFYRLILSPEDVEEITRLRAVIPYLRNAEPLNKVIWKVYYEKPYTDLIGRVIGSGIHCGIYKITNLNNQMCYIGQAVDIASRWKQHIKRGIGADTPTRNKLYPAMLENGVENFSFEVVEECPRQQLNQREDYWQQYFKAKEFGYSIK